MLNPDRCWGKGVGSLLVINKMVMPVILLLNINENIRSIASDDVLKSINMNYFVRKDQSERRIISQIKRWQ